MPASEVLLTIKTDTKEEETEILSGLLSRLQYLASTITPRETPDFEIALNGHLIGVEITKYYSDYTRKGSKAQQTISEWKKFSEHLKSKLVELNPEYAYLYGAIHFKSDKVNYKQLLTKVHFDELIELISLADLGRNQQKTINVISDQYPALGENISSIFLWDTYPDNIYLWWNSKLQSGEVISNDSAINFLVEKKNKASESYKQDYYQKWLVIYAGGMSLQDMFLEKRNVTFRQGKIAITRMEADVLPDIDITISSSYFSHIILWDKFTEKIIQLFPYQKKIFDYGEKKIWVNHLPLKE